MSCEKNDEENENVINQEGYSMSIVDTHWTAQCCRLTNGEEGTKCDNGRREMCLDKYECSNDNPTFISALYENYSQDEIDYMFENGSEIEDPILIEALIADGFPIIN